MATFKCFFHPHHVSLIDTHAFRAKLNHVGDPYYNVDGFPSHRGVLAPKFDIFETKSSYILIGEVPGLLPSSKVNYEWLEDQTLFIRGNVDPLSSFDGDKAAEVKTVHSERQVGNFERSFTFPGKVKPDIEQKREDGLLKILILKE